MNTALNKNNEKEIMAALVNASARGSMDIKSYDAKIEKKGERRAILSKSALAAFAVGMCALGFNSLQGDGTEREISLDGKPVATMSQTLSAIEAMSDKDWGAIRFMSKEIASATQALFEGEAQAKGYLSACIAQSMVAQEDKRPISEQLDELLSKASADGVLASTYIAAKCISPNDWQGQYSQWRDLATRGVIDDPRMANALAVDAMAQFIEQSESIAQSVRQSPALLDYNNQVAATQRKVSSSAYDWFSAASSVASGVGAVVGSKKLEDLGGTARKMGSTTRTAESASRGIDRASSSARKWKAIGDAAKRANSEMKRYETNNGNKRMR